MDDGYTRISYAWRLGYRVIPVVHLWRRAQQVASRYRFLTVQLAVWLVLAVPIGVYLASALLGWPVSLEVIVWTSGFSVLQVMMCWAAHETWAYVGTRAGRIDGMLDQRSSRASSTWLLRQYGVTQIAVILIGGLAASVYLGLFASEISKIVALDWISYVSVAISGAIGANVCYWLWTAPVLIKRIVQLGNLRLRWYDPASTPGIRLLSEGLGLAALLLAYGAVAIAVGTFALPRALAARPIVNLLLAFAALVLVLSVRVAFLPFIWIFRAVTNSKRETLDALTNQMPLDPPMQSMISESLSDQIAVYQQISGRPNLPFSTAAMVQYVGVMLGGVIGFISAAVVK